MELELLMKVKIWKNQYADGMFNYKNVNNDEYKNEYFELKVKDCFFLKNIDNDVICVKDYREFNLNKSEEILFRIRKSLKNNNYEVINPIIPLKINTSKYSNDYLKYKIWYPAKSLRNNSEGNNQDYSLNKNDIIKLGKNIYLVDKLNIVLKEEKDNIKDDNFNKNNNISYIISINKNSKSIFNIDITSNQYKIIDHKNNINNEKVIAINEPKIKNENENEYKSFSESDNDYDNDSNNNDIKSENEDIKCYSCLNSDSDKNNPLICLCNCHSYIHYECLKKHLLSKITVIENFKKTVTTYICQKFNCDSCLKPYHSRFRIPEFDKIYELIDLTFPEESDYICLESLNYIRYNENIKILYIVQLIDQEITIGRQDYNDIIDNDTSISREHAVLRYNKNNGNLFLEDRNGKYGTLVLVRGNIKIKKEKTFIQIGNTYISIELKDN